jgi:RNA polymerase sigma-70 factor, ECF subfamily
VAFPGASEELALHERVLAGDPVVPVDVFQGLMEPLQKALRHDLRCTEDEAHDSSVDAILSYLEEPRRYDPNRGRLSTYLMDIAKKRAIDRLRSRTASAQRDENYAATVELDRSNPKEIMEAELEAQELWKRVEEVVPSDRDRQALKLILAGERSTAALAGALGVADLSPLEQRREVKQQRDRLMKILERLGMRLGHDDA